MTAASFVVEGRKFVNLNGSHRNHFAHQALMNEWQALAFAAIHKANLAPIEPPVVITATVRRTRNGCADAHNVMPSIKACIDALVRAGLIPNDCDHVVSRLITEGGPKAPRPTIELTLEEA